jgi:hypothetical protein
MPVSSGFHWVFWRGRIQDSPLRQRNCNVDDVRSAGSNCAAGEGLPWQTPTVKPGSRRGELHVRPRSEDQTNLGVQTDSDFAVSLSPLEKTIQGSSLSTFLLTRQHLLAAKPAPIGLGSLLDPTAAPIGLGSLLDPTAAPIGLGSLLDPTAAPIGLGSLAALTGCSRFYFQLSASVSRPV